MVRILVRMIRSSLCTIRIWIQTLRIPLRTIRIGLRTIRHGLPTIRIGLQVVHEAPRTVRKSFTIVAPVRRTIRKPLDAGRLSFVSFRREVPMTREEYEARRMALEQQLQADMALIQAAHATRIRSLERLWQAAEAGEESEAAPLPVAEPRAPAAAPRPKPESSRPPGVVLDDLEAALPQLPQTFDRRDIDRLLGYRAVRPTLYRALGRLQSAGRVEIVRYSGGGHRTRYRKLS